MIGKTLYAAAAALIALTTLAAAHEGHEHTALGTVESLDAETLVLATEDEATETFALTEATKFTSGDDQVSIDQVEVGGRAVVVYETKDKVNYALEVQLPPK